MQVLISFSTFARFVLWLVVAGVLTGGVLLGQFGAEPTGGGGEVTVHAAAPGH